jgi:hypothetical protein
MRVVFSAFGSASREQRSPPLHPGYAQKLRLKRQVKAPSKTLKKALKREFGGF